jgi:hypothetical protein
MEYVNAKLLREIKSIEKYSRDPFGVCEEEAREWACAIVERDDALYVMTSNGHVALYVVGLREPTTSWRRDFTRWHLHSSFFGPTDGANGYVLWANQVGTLRDFVKRYHDEIVALYAYNTVRHSLDVFLPRVNDDDDVTVKTVDYGPASLRWHRWIYRPDRGLVIVEDFDDEGTRYTFDGYLRSRNPLAAIQHARARYFEARTGLRYSSDER